MTGFLKLIDYDPKMHVVQNDPYISTKIETRVTMSIPSQEQDELQKKKG